MTGETIKIGAIVPLSGAGGIFGPSCCNCFRLAADKINASGGLLGKRIDLIFIDGGQLPIDVASSVRSFLDHDMLGALVGMHDSDVRAAIIETGPMSVPYVYTPTFEGGEDADGVFYIGETPHQQLKTILPCLMTHRGILSWYLIGNDYSWPHKMNAMARRFIGEEGGKVVAEHYVPFGTEDFTDYVEDLAGIGADAVLISLVGRDSAAFNRSFLAAELSNSVHRYGPLIEENTLYAMGEGGGQNLYTSSGYFEAVQTDGNAKFLREYAEQFGTDAPVVTGLAQSCHEGLMFLHALVGEANTLAPNTLSSVSEGFTFEGTCGPVKMTNRHLTKSIYLAEADGFDFRIIDQFEDVAPE